MIDIVTTVLKKQNISCSFLRPYVTVSDRIQTQEVTLHILHHAWKPFFPAILNRLEKKHPSLIYSESLKPNEKPLASLFSKKLEEILTLAHRGTPGKIALLCQKEDSRLLSVLKTVSPFSKTVSFVTDDSLLFEKVCEKALWELGLTVNQRSVNQLENPDLVILISGEFDLKNLNQGALINLSDQPVSCTLPTLDAVTNTAVSAFLARHPYVHLNPSYLLSENASITSLIWKYR